MFLESNAIAQKAGKQLASEDRMIEELLAKMTPDEKIGQLSLFTSDWSVTGPSINENYKKLIREGKAGAIFNAYTVDYVRGLQKIAVEESRLKIPLLFGYDVIHGHRTIFPIPLGQAATWDMKLIGESERVAAREATAEGINWTFAPMVDIARDPRWGRVSEGAGEDTWLACRIAEARVRGFQGNDLSDPSTLLACVKHFAAYGAPQAGRDYHTVDMSPVTLHEWYLPPYKAGIDAGAGSVMTSFNEISGVPATSNPWLLTELLRKQWGFGGFVVTDYTSINELVPHGVAADIRQAARLAILAGVDMDMQGSTFLDALPGLLKDNKVDISRVDDAVRVVLRAKIRLGLFEDPYRYCNKEREAREIMTKENLDLARRFVSESCVLLKNQEQTLPIPNGIGSIAVIGPLGNSKKDMLGNWSAAGKWENCVTLLEGLRNRAKNISVSYVFGCEVNGTSKAGFDSALAIARASDYVILALGESGEMSGEAASRSEIDLPGVQNELAEAIFALGKPVAVVLFNGRPLAIERLASKAPAILVSWFGGTEAGNGIADVLFGDHNPSGKLTMTFPRNTGQIPIFYNMKNTGRPYNPQDPNAKYVSRYLDVTNEPLYPFGYGLSYTTFSYSGIEVKVNGNEITVTAKVTNTGGRDGTEVAQLYVQDKIGTMTRPVRELKGFSKVFLKKGESVSLSFLLTKDDLSFYHQDLKRYFEPGVFVFYVGTDSGATLRKEVDIL